MLLYDIIIHGIGTDRDKDWYKPVHRAVVKANPNYTCMPVPIEWESIRDRSIGLKKDLGIVDDTLSDLSAVFDINVLSYVHDKFMEALGHAGNARIIVIGHSYGSIFAYMASHAAAKTFGNFQPIDLLVTVGSPIWIADRGLLKRIFRKPVKPRSVREWRNVIGMLDEVTGFGLGTIDAADKNIRVIAKHELLCYSSRPNFIKTLKVD